MTGQPLPAVRYAFRISCGARLGPHVSLRHWADLPAAPPALAGRYGEKWPTAAAADASAARLQTAASLFNITLDPDRCRFGPTRLLLVGSMTLDPPRAASAHRAWQPVGQASRIAFAAAAWTLRTVYGMNPNYVADRVGDSPLPRPVDLTLREIR